MASKQLVTLGGAVTSVNSKKTGIKVVGCDDWLNISQYHPVAVLPTVGELVEVQVEQTDRGMWINSLQIIGASAAGSNPPPALGLDRTSVRLAVLQAAATFSSGYAQMREEVKSSDVLKIADAWLRWVEGGDADR